MLDNFDQFQEAKYPLRELWKHSLRDKEVVDPEALRQYAEVYQQINGAKVDDYHQLYLKTLGLRR